ncbi:IS110 family transposase [Streptomyces sp. NPDC003710]
MRRNLQPLQDGDEVAVELKILTGRRYDLAADRTRAIDRMRAQLLEYFPALEQVAEMPIEMGRPLESHSCLRRTAARPRRRRPNGCGRVGAGCCCRPALSARCWASLRAPGSAVTQERL